ncbi:MAG: hypothetical protein GY913_19825 [Proteobacteria bacterium]|nr:hypothetical protein [Pseudomonadota bacterium]
MSFLFIALACTSGGNGECIDDGNCADGEACVEGTCMVVDCMTSDECEIGEFCHIGTHTCKPGCHEDSDCLAGEQCNQGANQCEQAGCRTAELDCYAGQTCDPVSGQCTDVGVCEQECHVYNQPNCGPGLCLASTTNTCHTANDCDAGASCDDFLTSSSPCSHVSQCPEGTDECDWLGQCISSYCHIDYCYDPCDSDDACPAAFTCVDYASWGYGPTCVGDCGYLQENGHL